MAAEAIIEIDEGEVEQDKLIAYLEKCEGVTAVTPEAEGEHALRFEGSQADAERLTAKAVRGAQEVLGVRPEAFEVVALRGA